MLLAAGALAVDSLAAPVLTGHKAWSRDAARGEEPRSDDSARFEKYPLQADGWWSLSSGIIVGEIAVHSGSLERWAGANDIPSGPDGYADLPALFESAFNQNSLYPELLRRRGTAISHPAGGSDPGLGGVTDSVLRNAWDSVADDGNTANISLAGIELSLTLRGDQRSLMINGYDLSSMVLPGTQSQEPWQVAARAAVPGDGARAAETASGAAFASEPATGGNVISELQVAFEATRGIVTHPLTMFFALTYMLTWISVRVVQALRERRRSYQRYRR